MGTVFGFEEEISYAKNFFGDTPGAANSVFSAMSNVLIGAGIGPVRPYVVGGVTAMFGSHVGIRGDLRHFHTLQDVNLLIFKGQKLDFWRASAGLALAF